MTKVSIIATFYNLEKYMTKCLDSLISQTLDDIEIICLDDGSTDRTSEILDEYTKKDARIKVIHKQNEGVSATRNLGISLAKGKYILFVDGDDYIEPDTCEITYRKAIETKSDIIVFQLKQPKTTRNYFKQSSVYYELKNTKFEFFDKIPQYFQGVEGMYFIDKLYKRELLINNKINFPSEYNFGEDSMFVIQVLATNPIITIIDNQFYHIIEREGSLSRQKDKWNSTKKYFEDYTYFINDFFVNNKFLPQQLHIELINSISKYLVGFCGIFYFSKNKDEAVILLKKYLNNYYQFENYQNIKGYQKIKKHLTFIKYHISWWYWKIIRPIGKYCIVLPYRRFREFLRSNNGK